MLAGIRSRLTYANVMATIAVFLALGGGIAWALGRNSVRSKHIVNGQVKSADVEDDGLSGEDVSEETLDPDTLPGPDPAEFTDVGLPPKAAPGCEGPGWYDDLFDNGRNAASVYRDPTGIVHLRGGVIQCAGAGPNPFFILPAGYRPASEENFLASASGSVSAVRIEVDTGGAVSASCQCPPDHVFPRRDYLPLRPLGAGRLPVANRAAGVGALDEKHLLREPGGLLRFERRQEVAQVICDRPPSQPEREEGPEHISLDAPQVSNRVNLDAAAAVFRRRG